MNTLDLRPLALGEILDRTFTLYRGYFVLFLGISAIPRSLLLLLNVAQTFLLIPLGFGGIGPRAPAPTEAMMRGLMAFMALASLSFIVGLLVILLTQGATVIAVSELYLGRTITIADSFRRVRGELGTLLGLLILSGLAIIAGCIFLIIPGIYLMCRLLVGVPAALAEKLGPTEAFERSFSLTSNNAGRAFVILLLYFAIFMGAALLFVVPFDIGMFASRGNPSMTMFWTAMVQVGGFAASVFVTPILTIASAVFYYDLRVRKEAFDLQMLMSPLSAPASGSVPTVS